MSRVEPRVLKGFRDYLPDTMVPRERMLRTVTRVFEQFGFLPLATPAIEYTEVLLGKYGREGEKLLYRFPDNGGRDVSLRYDLTVPLARVIAQYPELPRPFRRYQIAPVWRAEKPGRGRFREFVQCDADVVGSTSLMADFECVQVAVAVLGALEVDDFTIRLNDRRVLDGLMARIGIREPKVVQDVLRVIDKLPKLGWPAVDAELESALSLDTAARAAIQRFLDGTLESIDGDVVDLAVAEPGLASLRQLLSWAEALGVRERLAVDLSIARGLDYYTSTIYETFLGGLPGFGSVMSGGRYDGLMGTFSAQSVPAVGISLGVDRLLAGLVELGRLDAAPTPPDVYVTVFDEAGVAYAQRVGAIARAAGRIAQVHLEPGQKLGKQFQAATRVKARWVVVAGPGERDAQQVAVKHLDTGSQVTLGIAELGAWLASQ